MLTYFFRWAIKHAATGVPGVSTTLREAKPVFWIGETPSSCQLCDKSIVSSFVDGKLKIGPWASCCLFCHRVHGIGLGTGLGQLYRRQPDNRWLKCEE